MSDIEGARVIEMRDMKPLQVGVVLDSGDIVMRSANVLRHEVMNLTSMFESKYWVSKNCTLAVRLLTKDEKIALILTND